MLTLIHAPNTRSTRILALIAEMDRNRPIATALLSGGFSTNPLSLLTSLTTSFAVGMRCDRKS